MPEPVQIAEAARELQVSTSTLRRWIAEGAPTYRLGEAGRGKGSLVDIDAIRAWRAERAGLTPTDQEFDFDTIADGLLEAFKRGNRGETDPVWRDLQVDSRRAALLFAEAFIAIHRCVTGREPTRYPRSVQTLHRCAVLPSSMHAPEDRRHD